MHTNPIAGEDRVGQHGLVIHPVATNDNRYACTGQGGHKGVMLACDQRRIGKAVADIDVGAVGVTLVAGQEVVHQIHCCAAEVDRTAAVERRVAVEAVALQVNHCATIDKEGAPFIAGSIAVKQAVTDHRGCATQEISRATIQRAVADELGIADDGLVKQTHGAALITRLIVEKIAIAQGEEIAFQRAAIIAGPIADKLTALDGQATKALDGASVIPGAILQKIGSAYRGAFITIQGAPFQPCPIKGKAGVSDGDWHDGEDGAAKAIGTVSGEARSVHRDEIHSEDRTTIFAGIVLLKG